MLTPEIRIDFDIGKTVHRRKLQVDYFQTDKNRKCYNIPRACLLSVVNRIWNRGPKPDNRGIMKILPMGPNLFRGIWGYSAPENFESFLPEIG